MAVLVACVKLQCEVPKTWLLPFLTLHSFITVFWMTSTENVLCAWSQPYFFWKHTNWSLVNIADKIIFKQVFLNSNKPFNKMITHKMLHFEYICFSKIHIQHDKAKRHSTVEKAFVGRYLSEIIWGVPVQSLQQERITRNTYYNLTLVSGHG